MAKTKRRKALMKTIDDDPLQGLVDPDDWEMREWFRTCSWSRETKIEHLRELRAHGLRDAMEKTQTKQIADLEA
jgi:hypothetical protein